MNIPKPVVKGFVIYNPKTQLFSRGGYGPRWSKTPKIWSNIGHMKNHIGVAISTYPYGRRDNTTKEIPLNECYVDCVVYDVSTDSETNFNIYGYVKERFMDSYYARNGYVLTLKGNVL